MRAAAILSVLLVAACASSVDTTFRSELHDHYASRRPITVAIRMESGSRVLADALYRGLIEKGYSVLAPGVPVGTEAGILRVEVITRAAPWDAEATLEDPTGTRIYEMNVEGLDGDPRDLADALLLDLPEK